MCQKALGKVCFLAIALGATPVVQAAQYLLISRSAAGVWSFQEAQSLSANGKEKLRGGPPAPSANPFDSKAIGKLPEVQWSSFRIVRRAPDGALLGRTAESANWQLILPEGT